MPIVQLMVLGVIIAAFAIFIVVLLSVSLYVSAGKKDEAPTTTVTPARRADETAFANRTETPQPDNVRRFG